MTPPEEITLWVGACRYYLGRQTYAVQDFCNLLQEQWPTLHPQTRKVILRDVQEAFERDDNARQNHEPIRWLGDDCDRAEWEKVKGLPP